MRFEVPQFIEVEDKIFGPLTWRQFVYVAGGLGIGAVLFFMTPFIIFVLVGVPIAALTFALAFYPVNSRPFSLFLESMLRYLKGTKLYLWKKKGTGIYGGAYDTPSTPEAAGVYTPPTSKQNLNSLSRRLELTAIQKPEEGTDA